jgi:1-deoxy-D-xylulose-5-phosphate reductoisomerase
LLAIARQCLAAGGNACAVFHGANEEAVAAFLNGRIRFPRIGEIVLETLDAYGGGEVTSLEGCVRSVDRAREIAAEIIGPAA